MHFSLVISNAEYSIRKLCFVLLWIPTAVSETAGIYIPIFTSVLQYSTFCNGQNII